MIFQNLISNLRDLYCHIYLYNHYYLGYYHYLIYSLVLKIPSLSISLKFRFPNLISYFRSSVFLHQSNYSLSSLFYLFMCLFLKIQSLNNFSKFRSLNLNSNFRNFDFHINLFNHHFIHFFIFLFLKFNFWTIHQNSDFQIELPKFIFYIYLIIIIFIIIIILFYSFQKFLFQVIPIF